MASPNMHLAIAKKYLEKNPGIDSASFLSGTIYPDAMRDNKAITHYTIKVSTDSLKKHLINKVNLYNFLQDHKNMNSFELGWFLHLVGDYIFFTECFDEEYIDKVDYKDFCHALYYSYDCTNKYLWGKYSLTMDDLTEYPGEYYPGFPEYRKCILTIEQVENFIDKVSSIDINKYIEKILKTGYNVKP